MAWMNRQMLRLKDNSLSSPPKPPYPLTSRLEQAIRKLIGKRPICRHRLHVRQDLQTSAQIRRCATTHSFQHSLGGRFRPPVLFALRARRQDTFWHTCQDPPDRGARCLVELCQLPQTEAASPVTKDCCVIEIQGAAPQPSAFEPGAAHAAADPFPD